MRVPAADLAAQHVALREPILAAATRVLESGAFIGGQDVQAFESEFAAYCGVKHCVGVANGTDALILALRALRVSQADLVAVPAFTFAATAEAVLLAGARILFVDVDPGTLNLDPEDLRRRAKNAGGRLRAILAVHLYGQPAAMAELQQVAAEFGAVLIEDAAQAHGATSGGKRAGGLGRMACFSFYPTKNLGAAGDAGAITTDDDGYVERLRLLRDHGQSAKYEHTVLGQNSRLDALQAAILRIKLPRLEEWNARRRAIAQIYQERLAPTELLLPQPCPGNESVYHLYVVRHAEREPLMDHLRTCGIASAIHYPHALPRQRAFRDSAGESDRWPVAEEAARSVFSLPCFPELSDADVHYVCDQVLSWFSNR